MLGRSRTSIERLIEVGRLHIAARAGSHKRHLFERGAVERLGAALNTKFDDLVLLRDYESQRVDLEDRRRALVDALVADDVWAPHWRRFVVALHRRTPRLIARAASVVGALSPDDPLARRIDLAAPAPAGVPDLEIIRPWLVDCAGWLATSPAFRRVAETLIPPPAPAPAAPAATVAEARSAWRAARSAWRSSRVAARRGHRPRASVQAAVTDALTAWRACWWDWRAELAAQAGDPARIRRDGEAVAERARVALLAVAP